MSQQITSQQVLNNAKGMADQQAKRQLVRGDVIDVQNIDPRTEVQRLDKMSLYRLLDASGLIEGSKIHENTDYAKMQAYADVNSDELRWDKVELRFDGYGGILVKKPIAHIVKEREYDAQVQERRKELSLKTRPELVKLATAKGYKVTDQHKHEELVEELSK